MEVKQHYETPTERKTLIERYENQELEFGSIKMRMLTDKFDNPNWKHGDPEVGTMTFTDVMPTIISEPVRDLLAEIEALKIRVDEIAALIKYNTQGAGSW